MQIQLLPSLAACALSLGAAAAQSAPRVLQVDEAPAAGLRLAAPKAATAPVQVRTLAPAETAEPLLAELVTGAPGQVLLSRTLQDAAQQGYLGVMLATSGEEEGAAGVQSVVDGAPAQKAGVQAGDRITAVDGQAVTDAGSLTAAVRGKKPGTEVTLSLVRNGEAQELKVTLGERNGGGGGMLAAPAPPAAPKPAAPDLAPETLELRTLDIDDEAEPGNGRRARIRVVRPDSGATMVVPAPAQSEGHSEHRVEVRAESKDGEHDVRVWVNGEEVDAEGLEGLDGLWTSLDGDVDFQFVPDAQQHTFRFEAAEPGQQGEVHILRKRKSGGSDEHEGSIRVEGHALALPGLDGSAPLAGMLPHGFSFEAMGANPLQGRVDELESQVQRLEAKVRDLERAIDGLRGDARPREERRARNMFAELPPSLQIERQSVDADESAGTEGNDELRKEMRDLMRAIERLERRTGGGR